MGKKKERHISGESTMSTDSAYIPTPPDGGWGWVVCLASFLNHVIVDGIAFTFGVFYIEFQQYFGASKGKTALVGSLLCGCYLMTGPVASALTNRFGCRPVCIAGSIFACAAFLLSTLSTNIDMLILTYGVMGGIGFGLIYLPSVISVSYYFEKRRALATGVAVCGAGVGTFAFAPAGRWLLEVMDWQNAMMVLAGVVLNAAICGMLMRPLEPPSRYKKPRAKNMLDRLKEQAQAKLRAGRPRQESECSVCAHGVKNEDILQKVQEAKLAREKALREDDSESEMSSMPSLALQSLKRQDSRQTSRTGSFCVIREGVRTENADVTPATPSKAIVPQIVVEGDVDVTTPASTLLPNGNAVDAAKDDTAITNETAAATAEKPVEKGVVTSKSNGTVSNMDKTKTASSPEKDIDVNKNGMIPSASVRFNRSVQVTSATTNGHLSPVTDITDGLKSVSASDIWAVPSQHRPQRRKRPPGVSKEDYSRPMYRKDIFYSGSILAIPEFRSQPTVRSYVKSITDVPGEFPMDEESKISKCICLPKSARDTLRAMLDVSIFKDPVFLIICISNVFGMLGMYVPFIYLPEKAMMQGVGPGQASFLLSVIGITNTIGRVAAGVLADLPNVNSLLLHNLSIVLGGASCMLISLLPNYAALCTYAAAFGLCIATWISLTSIVLCNLLGLDKLTNAFGMLTLTRGVAVIAGPPIAGAVFDTTGSLDHSFFIGGGMLILAGLISCILHLKYFNRRQKKLTEAAKPAVLTEDELFASLEEEERMLKDNPVIFKAMQNSEA